MRTLDRLCAGLQEGPVHVLLKIPNIPLQRSSIRNKQTNKKFLQTISGNKHPSAGLRHQSASSHSYQNVLKHHTAACTNCPSMDTNSNKILQAPEVVPHMYTESV